MKGQPIVGIHKDTNEIIPISKVILVGLKCDCICYTCGSALEAVLNTSKRQHFRHSTKANCHPTPETELHLLAKTIILANSKIFIPGKGMTDYTDAVCEIRCDDLIPDAAVKVNGKEVFIEIVVTHPIDAIKYKKYQNKQAVVLVINLDEEDRDLNHEILESLVIGEQINKHVLSYAQDSLPLQTDNHFWKWIVGFGLAGLYVWKKVLGPRHPKRRRYNRKR